MERKNILILLYLVISLLYISQDLIFENFVKGGADAPRSIRAADSLVQGVESPRAVDFGLVKLPDDDLPFMDEDVVPEYGLADDRGIPLLFLNGKVVYHPVYILQRAIVSLSLYMKSGQKEKLNFTLLLAEKLTSISVEVSSASFFPYTVDYQHGDTSLNAPWYSGMAQGLALLFYTRLYHVTGEERFRDIADQCLNSLDPSLQNPFGIWVSGLDRSGYYWIEEYPSTPPDHTLNGFIFAVYGLYEHHFRIHNNKRAEELLTAALTTIMDNMDKYRSKGNYSRYCLLHDINVRGYHSLHIRQFLQLYKMTNETKFLQFSEALKADAS